MAEQNNGPTEGPLSWFPWGRQDLPGWRFDVITLLAVIGESSVADHAQTLTASSLCLLPRIIPAPQALLRPSRPQRLPEATAKMAGVYGGVVLDTVGFFANIMHPLEDLKPFAFKVLEIKHTHLIERRTAAPTPARKGLRERFAELGGALARRRGRGATIQAGGVASAGAGAQAAGRTTTRKQQTVRFEEDLEQGIVLNDQQPQQPPSPETLLAQPRPRARTNSERVTDILTTPTMVTSEDRYTVPPKYYSPHHLLSVFSFLLTGAIIAASALWKDGTAILAVGLVSVAGTVVCYASWWRPILMRRPTTNEVPPGDVVIRTREGAFVLVRCTEEVARELYSGTEECRYVSGEYHRAFMGLGMVLLMVSVVLLGNCQWNSQVFIGGSYILLNGLYWLLGLLPQRYFWDLGRYEVQDVTPEDAMRADEETDPDDPREGTPSFTRTLWYAVRETANAPGNAAWVKRSGAMPVTTQWKKWLEEALKEAQQGNRKWEAVRRKNEIMKDRVDEAEQRAPLLEVQATGGTRRSRGSSTF